MSEASTLQKIRDLEARIAELNREGAARAQDPTFQAQLRGTLLLLAQEQAKELERMDRLYRESGRQLEQHRRRVAVTVHDLKAPITISLLNLELLEMEKDPEQSAFYITGVRRELEFMLDTIANLLELERSAEERKELHMEPVALHPLVEAAVGRMSVLILDKPALRLENAVPADLPPVRAHPHRLTRVFNNLLSNAIKYTESGEVRVSAGGSGSGAVRVLVQDSGTGIDPERLPRIFTYYEGDEHQPDSTGIGLAFVKQVIDAHRGKVWIESERGVGTKVFVELPPWSADGR